MPPETTETKKTNLSVSELIELKRELSEDMTYAFNKFNKKANGHFKDVDISTIKAASYSPCHSDVIVRINVDIIL